MEDMSIHDFVKAHQLVKLGSDPKLEKLAEWRQEFIASRDVPTDEGDATSADAKKLARTRSRKGFEWFFSVQVTPLDAEAAQMLGQP